MLVVMSLLEKLEIPAERVRLGTLSCLRHLINSSGLFHIFYLCPIGCLLCESDAQMCDKKDLVLSGVKKVVNDPSNQVSVISCD
jgi:hypothetical protein